MSAIRGAGRIGEDNAAPAAGAPEAGYDGGGDLAAGTALAAGGSAPSLSSAACGKNILPGGTSMKAIIRGLAAMVSSPGSWVSWLTTVIVHLQTTDVRGW
jgi:hypothetical protein